MTYQAIRTIRYGGGWTQRCGKPVRDTEQQAKTDALALAGTARWQMEAQPDQIDWTIPMRSGTEVTIEIITTEQNQ